MSRKKAAKFTVTGGNQLGPQIGPRDLIDVCLAENERRMTGYDPRLKRPETMPALAKFLRRFFR